MSIHPLLAAMTLCVCGCGWDTSSSSQSLSPIVAGPHAYLALGDSYTLGHGVEEHERWPNLLAQELRREKVELSAPHIIARTGWLTSDLLIAINHRSFAGTFELVTLQIGVNDQYSKIPLNDFRLRFEQLIAKAIELAGNQPARVVILSIPDYNFGSHRKFAPDNISESIDQFNAICQEASQQHGVTFIDITAQSREARDYRELWAVDELHFSGKMYRKWVDLIAPIVKLQINQTKNASP